MSINNYSLELYETIFMVLVNRNIFFFLTLTYTKPAILQSFVVYIKYLTMNTRAIVL